MSGTQADAWLVVIEFLRVQTFLFSVRRLREMVGANVQLGEMVREQLPKLAVEHGAYCPPGGEALILPGADATDPLSASKSPDDPRGLVARGILGRDGGRLSALFPDEGRALAFSRAARDTLQQALPGLLFTIHPARDLAGGEAEDQVSGEVAVQTLVELPVFQVCQVSGNGPASALQPAQDRNEEPRWVGRAAKERRARAGAFFGRQPTHDIIGLLQDAIPLSGCKAAEDFETLCGPYRRLGGANGESAAGDYLAVIHADGNGIGKRFQAWRRDQAPRFSLGWCNEARHELFFHPMRVAVRRAVLAGLQVFAGCDAPFRPYQLLMLGGDDLLLVCRAQYALDFVVEYARALEKSQLADGQPLSVGVGVVIAAPTFPFHYLHHLAEALAGSAKMKQRALGQEVSVVDWMVTTYSWSDDPVAMRRRDALVRYQTAAGAETLILSEKPYTVLDGDAGPGLAALLQDARDVAAVGDEGGRVARSQLRRLVDTLPLGRGLAQLRLGEMPEVARRSLGRARHLAQGKALPWRGLAAAEGEGAVWSSALADLVEVYEIAHLGGYSARGEEAQRGVEVGDA